MSANPHGQLLQLVAQRLAASGGDACRLFHGRGRLYPGYEQLSIDYYQPVILLTLFEPCDDSWLDTLVAGLRELAPDSSEACIAVQRRYAQDVPLVCLFGELPRKQVAREQGLQFGIQLGGRQNVGFFLDMAEARAWLRDHAADKNVLNLFAYTCAFSVVAREAGASQVVNLDMSAAALRQGQQNHQRNGHVGGTRFLAHDLFKSWAKLRRTGPYDVVIVDPPSRQPGSFVAERDYARVLRKIPGLCNSGADLLICLNSPHLEPGFLIDLVAEEAPGLELQGRLPNPQAFVDSNEDLSLKVLHYRLLSR